MGEVSVDVMTNLLTTIGTNMVANIADVFPRIIVAILIFLLGWIVAIIISRIFAKFLHVVKLEEYLKSHKLEDALGTVKISSALTKILKYYLLLVFLQVAVGFTGLDALSDFLGYIVIIGPTFIAIALLLLISVLLGEYIKETLHDLDPKSSLVGFIARAVKWLIVYFAVVMSLSRLDFDTSILRESFTIVLQGAVYGVALAAGLAFGLGGQKDAEDLIGKWRKHLKI